MLEPQGQNVSKEASRASHGRRGTDVLRGKLSLGTNFWCIRTRKLDWERDLWLSGCVADLRKEEPLLPHSSNTHVKADYPHCESRGDVEGVFFFFSPLEGVFFRGLNTPTEQQRETWSEQPTRVKCEAELTEGKDIYPAVVFGLAKMGRKLLFSLIFILCLSVTLQGKGRRRFCDIFSFFGNFVDATLFKSAGRRSCFWMLKRTTSTSYFSLLQGIRNQISYSYKLQLVAVADLLCDCLRFTLHITTHKISDLWGNQRPAGRFPLQTVVAPADHWLQGVVVLLFMIHKRLLKNLNYILFSLNRFKVLTVKQTLKKVPLKNFKSLCINMNPDYY